MGMFDTYAGVQLKVGPCTLRDYEVGDKVEIDDGIYVGWDGYVAIEGGELVCQCDRLTTTHGESISPAEILQELQRLRAALSNYEVLLFDIQTALDEYEWTDFPAHVREELLSRIRKVLEKGEGE